jgi:RNA polymerase sigma-70 factor (family 1)
MTGYTHHTDEAVAALLKKSDAAAFTELYDRYHARVYGYLLAMLKLPELSEDLVHEVFLKLWEARERLVVTGSFSAYLFRMCHNKAVDALRKQVHDREWLAALQATYTSMIDTTTSSGNITAIDDTFSQELFDTALSSLTPQRRAVYRLCKQEGKSYREAAAALGISVHTVKEHMTNALADLRAFVQRRGELALLFFLWEKIS